MAEMQVIRHESNPGGEKTMIAMTPLITVQIMGLIAVIKSRRVIPLQPEAFADDDIIELWETA